MRGKALHNLIAQRTGTAVSEFFEFVRLEYQYRKNGTTTFLDVFARQGSTEMAFEVETTSRHAVDNAIKAATIDIPLWIIVPTFRLKLELTRMLKDVALKPGNQPVNILLLGQLGKELMNYLSLIIPANRLKR